MIIKKISFFLLLSVLFMPTANADFLGIGGWTKRKIIEPVNRVVIKPTIKYTKHQIAVVRKSKAYKEADKVVQDARNTKAYKEADKVLVSASRAVRKDCEKALTTAFTPLVGAVCGAATTAAIGGACAITLGHTGITTGFLLPPGIAGVSLCVPIAGYTKEIGCDGPLSKGVKYANRYYSGPFGRIRLISKHQSNVNRLKKEGAHELAKLTCGLGL